jgi:protoporphyrin/coproporphyrin ferrochelatase
MKHPQDGVLLLAHGTIHDVSELADFLKSVRRGRPAPEALVAEMRHRYEAIGGSPLLRYTRDQASGLETRLGVPVEVAMRLWDPRVEEVLPRLLARGVRRVCLLPLAPFSVDVYVEAAKAAAASLGETGVEWVSVGAWGTDPAFIASHVELIQRTVKQDQPLVLTAHSLPTRVIAMGDRYAIEVEACVAAIAASLGRPVHLAYQSQGADGGDWLGPDLQTVLQQLTTQGETNVAIAPVGFLADHVETLYDLDVEVRALCEHLGLTLTRVPALNTEPSFLDALAGLVTRALGC